MSTKDLKEHKISSKIMYEGHIIRVEEDQVLCPNQNTATREVVRRGEASCILAFCDDGKIIVEKQYRYPYDEVILELPAGKKDNNEDHCTTAIRELEEETGFLAHHMTYLGKIYPTVGFCNEVIHLYLASSLEKTKQHLDENEMVKLVFLSFEEIQDMIIKGQIVDAKTICALYYYQLKKESL